MTDFSVGKEVISFCGKCKLPLTHMITAMKSADKIAKVECKTCGATHAYKDPAKASTTKRKATGKTRAKKVSISDLWMEKMGQTKKKSQAYSMKGNFELGDILDHKKFGPGIVDQVRDDKIEVIFRHEIKTLVHNK